MLPPDKKEIINATNTSGHPKIIPKNKAKIASPHPIAFSFVIHAKKEIVPHAKIIPKTQK